MTCFLNQFDNGFNIGALYSNQHMYGGQFGYWIKDFIAGDDIDAPLECVLDSDDVDNLSSESESLGISTTRCIYEDNYIMLYYQFTYIYSLGLVSQCLRLF